MNNTHVDKTPVSLFIKTIMNTLGLGVNSYYTKFNILKLNEFTGNQFIFTEYLRYLKDKDDVVVLKPTVKDYESLSITLYTDMGGRVRRVEVDF